ncbi:MAG: thioesterase [Lachnospiraceae bacterium]|nr:thioesterase [Lachnospiraceae bacterium]
MNNEKIQLFLLPFAGGNSASFKQLTELLDNRIEVISVEYAGRMSRHKEKFITDYEKFLEDTANYINVRCNGLPISLLGYSLGSVLVFDFIIKKKIKGDLKHCFICARGDLRDKSISQRYHELPNDEFLQKLINLGGFDQRILENQRFLEIYMEPVRKDYIVWSQYKYREEGNKIPCDTTVIYSSKDPLSVNAHGWRDLTEGNIDFYELGENHFFIHQYYRGMAEIINGHLGKYM